jgi:prepilin-type N-terminal cleavage/methylation domain
MSVNSYDTAKVNQKKQHGFTLIEIMIVVLVFGILLAIALPNFARARETTQRKACIGNLRKIEWAKDAWLMQNNYAQTETPHSSDLFGPGAYIEVEPQCPSGGKYTIGAGNVQPTCDYSGATPHLILGN